VARRKKLVVLANLAEDSRGELKAMIGELSGSKAEPEDTVAKPVHWSRRFAASGKENLAPKTRIS